MTRPLTIVVSGMIAADPHQGGATWAVLQYVLGLQRLGNEVFLIEPVQSASLRPLGASLAESTNAAYFDSVLHGFGLKQHAALLLAGTEQTIGLPYAQLTDVARRADLLINISGMLTDAALTEPIRARAYLDLDPAFIQLWQSQGIDMRLSGHTHHVTIGLALSEPDCPLPTCGRSWIKTLQPVVLDRWPVAGPIRYDAFTTVGNWRGYGSIQHESTFYGQKAHSFRQFVALPTRSPARFLLAMSLHSDEKQDLAALDANGWQLIDPRECAGTPERYQQFVQGSKAELGIAKSGYVVAQCGWFSDRSICYLASGRPVVAQETGFSRYLPSGEGLFAFRDLGELLAAIEAIERDYPRHAAAARRIAEEYFDSDKVLLRLLEALGVAR